jgi:response regulator RpfG family c-di-GMP phosphodiesterase
MLVHGTTILMRRSKRPTFLIAEPEPHEALSTRKLVLETAKFNVITAYSSEEALELLGAFPNINALVIVSGLKNRATVVKTAKKQKPKLPVIILSPNGTSSLEGGDHHVSSHEPEELLQLLRSLFGDPRG